MTPSSESWVDVAIIGAGAAGMATAIFAKRLNPELKFVLLEGARRPGAKILVSGGGRCNVTNALIRETDYCGGNRRIVRRVLAALDSAETARFFEEIGVRLHEEPLGKLFPDTNSAKTVVAALLREMERLRVDLRTDWRVADVGRDSVETRESFVENDTSQNNRHTSVLCGPSPRPSPGGKGSVGLFRISAIDGRAIRARCVVLATGGRSLPKTGSDGAGHAWAAALGHSLVPTTPALAPLVLDGDFHAGLSGISQDVELTIRAAPDKPVRVAGSMLWTHFGVSGPAALDASRHWHRATLEKRPVSITVNLLPGETGESLAAWLVEQAARQGRTRLATLLAQRLPARVAEALLARTGLAGTVQTAQLDRDGRRKLIEVLTALPLPVRDSRGYAHAEVTAGGVPLEEIDPATMASRVCPGLYLVGEILDVDGRIGGFNFQWAWCTAAVAGRAIAAGN